MKDINSEKKILFYFLLNKVYNYHLFKQLGCGFTLRNVLTQHITCLLRARDTTYALTQFANNLP
jgi:hypothetical protein